MRHDIYVDMLNQALGITGGQAWRVECGSPQEAQRVRMALYRRMTRGRAESRRQYSPDEYGYDRNPWEDIEIRSAGDALLLCLKEKKQLKTELVTLT